MHIEAYFRHAAAKCTHYEYKTLVWHFRLILSICPIKLPLLWCDILLSDANTLRLSSCRVTGVIECLTSIRNECSIFTVTGFDIDMSVQLECDDNLHSVDAYGNLVSFR